MASIGDYLDRMVARATSPDGNVRARVYDYTKAEVSFRPGAYGRYGEEGLSHQLCRLAATAWVAYHRGRTEAYRLSRDLTEAEAEAGAYRFESPKEREYEARLGVLEAEGAAPGGRVRVRSRGLTRWRVDIAPGTLRALDEKAFLAELHGAYGAWSEDRRVKLIVLKSEYFDLGLSRELLDELAKLKARTAELERRRRLRG